MVSATGVVPCSNFLWGNNPTTTQDESSTESSDVTQSNSCTPITTNSVLKTTTDGFIVVNERMQSSCTDIYAAGDCCCYLPTSNDSIINSSNLFYQMRLWSQVLLILPLYRLYLHNMCYHLYVILCCIKCKGLDKS